MSAGLLASTVTPGRTAPDVSLTTPAMPLACCAEAGVGRRSTDVRATTVVPITIVRTMDVSLVKEINVDQGLARKVETLGYYKIVCCHMSQRPIHSAGT